LIAALEKAVIKSIGKLLQCIGSGSDKVRTSPNVSATESNAFFFNYISTTCAGDGEIGILMRMVSLDCLNSGRRFLKSWVPWSMTWKHCIATRHHPLKTKTAS